MARRSIQDLQQLIVCRIGELTAEDVALHEGTTVANVRARVWRGDLPSLKSGASRRIPVAEYLDCRDELRRTEGERRQAS